MQKPPEQAPLAPTSRAEKLSILSAMLGPDAMARVRETRSQDVKDLNPQQIEVDAERAAWHRNRLLQRLRQQGGLKTKSVTQPTEKADAVSVKNLSNHQIPVPKNIQLDARLAKISSASTLGQEHPAIIARLIKTLSRDERVEALKSLPGPIARSIVRRLK